MSRVATMDDVEQVRLDLQRQMAPASLKPEVRSMQRWKRRWDQDAAAGRALMGPQYISDIELRDGSVVARTLEAELVLTTALIAGAISPADRVQMTGAGIEAYGEVNSTPNTKTFHLHNNGDFEFGVSPDQISFDAATGTLTVPSAVITALTIADVGSGVVGGDYDSNVGNPKIRLSPAGIRGFDSLGSQTFFLDATSGALFHTGTYSIGSSVSASDRIQMTQEGIELWKGGTREFYLRASGATNAITMLLTGPGVSDYIGLNPTDGLWLGASTFAGASAKISPAGVLTATGVSISGAITATSGTLGTLSVTGTLTLSGSGLFQTDPTSNRGIEIDTTGLYVYNSLGNTVGAIESSGSGFLGASVAYPNGVINWTSIGNLEIGGFDVTDTTLSSGTGGTFVTVSSGSIPFSAGGATPSTAPFNVTNAGVLSATGATISGNITATTGTLGTLTVTGTLGLSGAGYIRTNLSGNPHAELNTNGLVTVNSGGSTTSVINSNGSGYLGGPSILSWNTSGALTLSGFSASSTTLSSGTGGSFVTMSSGATAFSAGSATPSSAPFRVTNAGALTATSLTVGTAASGARVEMTSAGGTPGLFLHNGSIVTGFLSSTGSGFLGSTTGVSSNAAIRWTSGGTATIDATRITTGTLDASTITVTNLSASSITTGTLNVGSLTVTGTLSAANISGGTLGGGFSMGGSDITVNSTGKLKFGTSAADYLANDILHFATTSTEQGKVRMQAASTNRHAILYSSDSGSDAVGVFGVTTAAPTGNYNSVVFNAFLALDTDGVLTIGTADSTLTKFPTLTMNAPSELTTHVGGDFYVSGSTRYLRIGSSGSSGTGALPNPTNFIRIKDSAGNIRRIPTFANADTWGT